MLLNVAVSGAWGDTDRTQTSQLPQSLVVDWVRVYQDSAVNDTACSLAVRQRPGGRVVVDPTKIVYKPGEKVAIEAVADPGYSFVRWEGVDTSRRWRDTLVMESSGDLSAVFAPSVELLKNGDFASDWADWRPWNDSALHPVFAIVTGQGCVRPDVVDPEAWHVQIANGSFPVAAAEDLEVSFKARADSPHRMDFRLSQAESPYGGLTAPVHLTVGSSPQWIRTLVKTQAADPKARLELNLAQDSSEICFDSVSVRRISSTSRIPSGGMKPVVGVRVEAGSLELVATMRCDWVIRDLSGRRLRQGDLTAGQRASIGSLARGIYLVEILGENGRHAQWVTAIP